MNRISLHCRAEIDVYPTRAKKIHRFFPDASPSLYYPALCPQDARWESSRAYRIKLTSLEDTTVFAFGPRFELINPTLIGANTERDRRRTVTTDESVAQWCRDNLKDVMRAKGAKFDSLRYDVSLSGTVMEFAVTENEDYKASVTLGIKVCSQFGRALWDGVVYGKATNWGTSYKIENYYECLSDALVNAAHLLVSDGSLVHAVRGDREQIARAALRRARVKTT